MPTIEEILAGAQPTQNKVDDLGIKRVNGSIDNILSMTGQGSDVSKSGITTAPLGTPPPQKVQSATEPIKEEDQPGFFENFYGKVLEGMDQTQKSMYQKLKLDADADHGAGQLIEKILGKDFLPERIAAQDTEMAEDKTHQRTDGGLDMALMKAAKGADELMGTHALEHAVSYANEDLPQMLGSSFGLLGGGLVGEVAGTLVGGAIGATGGIGLLLAAGIGTAIGTSFGRYTESLTEAGDGYTQTAQALTEANRHLPKEKQLTNEQIHQKALQASDDVFYNNMKLLAFDIPTALVAFAPIGKAVTQFARTNSIVSKTLQEAGEWAATNSGKVYAAKLGQISLTEGGEEVAQQYIQDKASAKAQGKEYDPTWAEMFSDDQYRSAFLGGMTLGTFMHTVGHVKSKVVDIAHGITEPKILERLQSDQRINMMYDMLSRNRENEVSGWIKDWAKDPKSIVRKGAKMTEDEAKTWADDHLQTLEEAKKIYYALDNNDYNKDDKKAMFVNQMNALINDQEIEKLGAVAGNETQIKSRKTLSEISTAINKSISKLYQEKDKEKAKELRDNINKATTLLYGEIDLFTKEFPNSRMVGYTMSNGKFSKTLIENGRKALKEKISENKKEGEATTTEDVVAAAEELNEEILNPKPKEAQKAAAQPAQSASMATTETPALKSKFMTPNAGMEDIKITGQEDEEAKKTAEPKAAELKAAQPEKSTSKFLNPEQQKVDGSTQITGTAEEMADADEQSDTAESQIYSVASKNKAGAITNQMNRSDVDKMLGVDDKTPTTTFTGDMQTGKKKGTNESTFLHIKDGLLSQEAGTNKVKVKDEDGNIVEKELDRKGRTTKAYDMVDKHGQHYVVAFDEPKHGRKMSKAFNQFVGEEYASGIGYLLPVSKDGTLDRKRQVNFYAQTEKDGVLGYDDFESIKEKLGLRLADQKKETVKQEVKKEAEKKSNYIKVLGDDGKTRYYSVDEKGKKSSPLSKKVVSEIGEDKFKEELNKKAKREAKKTEKATESPKEKVAHFNATAHYEVDGKPARYVMTSANKNSFKHQFIVGNKKVNVENKDVDKRVKEVKSAEDVVQETEKGFPSLKGLSVDKVHGILEEALNSDEGMVDNSGNAITAIAGKDGITLSTGDKVAVIYDGNVIPENVPVFFKLHMPGEGLKFKNATAVFAENRWWWKFRKGSSSDFLYYPSSIEVINMNNGQSVGFVAATSFGDLNIRAQETQDTAPTGTVNKDKYSERIKRDIAAAEEHERKARELAKKTRGNLSSGGLGGGMENALMAVVHEAAAIALRTRAEWYKKTKNLNKVVEQAIAEFRNHLKKSGLFSHEEVNKYSNAMDKELRFEQTEDIFSDATGNMIDAENDQILELNGIDTESESSLKVSEIAKRLAFENRVSRFMRGVPGMTFDTAMQALSAFAKSNVDERNLYQSYFGPESTLDQRIKDHFLNNMVSEQNLASIQSYFKSLNVYEHKYMFTLKDGSIFWATSNDARVNKAIAEDLRANITEELQNDMATIEANGRTKFENITNAWTKQRAELKQALVKIRNAQTFTEYLKYLDAVFSNSVDVPDKRKIDVILARYEEFTGEKAPKNFNLKTQDLNTVVVNNIKDASDEMQDRLQSKMADLNEKQKQQAVNIISALQKLNNKIVADTTRIATGQSLRAATNLVNADIEYLHTVTGVPRDVLHQGMNTEVQQDKSGFDTIEESLVYRIPENKDFNNYVWKLMSENRFANKSANSDKTTYFSDPHKFYDSLLYSRGEKGLTGAIEHTIAKGITEGKQFTDSFTNSDGKRKDATRLMSHLQYSNDEIGNADVQAKYTNNDFVKDHADKPVEMFWASDIKNDKNDRKAVSVDKMTPLDIKVMMIHGFLSSEGKRYNQIIEQLGDNKHKVFVDVRKYTFEEAKKALESYPNKSFIKDGKTTEKFDAAVSEFVNVLTILGKQSPKYKYSEEQKLSIATDFVANWYANKAQTDEYYQGAFKSYKAQAKRASTISSPGLVGCNVAGGIYDLPNTKPGKHNVIAMQDPRMNAMIERAMKKANPHVFENIELANGFTFHLEEFNTAIGKSYGDLMGSDNEGTLNGIVKAMYSKNDVQDGRIVIKTNSIVLTEAFAKQYPAFMPIYKAMKENNIHRWTFTSSAKVYPESKLVKSYEQGSKEADPAKHAIWKNGKLVSLPKDLKSFIYEADSKNFLVQQDLTNPGTFDKGALPVQLFRFLTSLKSFDTISEQYKQIMEVTAAKVEQLFNLMDSDTWKEQLEKRLTDKPQDELFKQMLKDPNITRMHPVVRSIETSMIANIFKQNIFDKISNRTRMIEMPAFGESTELKGIHIKDGKVVAPEALVSIDYKNQLIERNGKKYLLIIRVPTTGFHSVTIVQVKDFLPEEMRNTIITDHATQEKAGADNDGDARFCLSRFKNVGKDEAKKISNQIIDTIFKEFEDKDNFDMLNEPINKAEFTEAIKEAKVKDNLAGLETNDPLDYITMHLNNSESQDCIGQAAMFNAFFSFAKKYGFKVLNSVGIDGRKLTELNFASGNAQEDLSRSASLANTSNVIIDNPNEMMMEIAGLSSATTSQFMLLQSMGVKLPSIIKFYRRKEVQEYIRLKREQASPFTSMTNKDIWNKLHKMFGSQKDEKGNWIGKKNIDIENEKSFESSDVIETLKNLTSLANDITKITQMIKANERGQVTFDEYYAIKQTYENTGKLNIQTNDTFQAATAFAPLQKSIQLMKKYWENTVFLSNKFGDQGDGILNLLRHVNAANKNFSDAQLNEDQLSAFKASVESYFAQEAMNIHETAAELKARGIEIFNEYIKGTELESYIRIYDGQLGINKGMRDKTKNLEDIQKVKDLIGALPEDVRIDLMKYQIANYGTSLSPWGGGFMSLFDNKTNAYLSQRMMAIAKSYNTGQHHYSNVDLLAKLVLANHKMIDSTSMNVTKTKQGYILTKGDTYEIKDRVKGGPDVVKKWGLNNNGFDVFVRRDDGFYEKVGTTSFDKYLFGFKKAETTKSTENVEIKAKGKMTFSYGPNKRSDVKSLTTFEAVKNGERTATTRYESDGHIDYWKNLNVGDIIQFENANGDTVLVEVTKPLHKLEASGMTAEQWSKLEGWSVDYFNKKVKSKLKEAWQIEYKLHDETAINSNDVNKIQYPGKPEFNKLPFRSEKPTMRYAGVGSRQTPPAILAEMKKVAAYLEKLGWVLRSGAAEGADKAFESGVKLNKEIFPTPAKAGAQELKIAAEIHPAWKVVSDFGRRAMARNTNQIFGEKLDTPVDFVIAWTQDGLTNYQNRSIQSGGTGQAIDMASRKGIPVVNMADPNWQQQLRAIVDDLQTKRDNSELKNQMAEKDAMEPLAKTDQELQDYIQERLAKRFPGVQRFQSREEFQAFLDKNHPGNALDINAIGSSIDRAVFIDPNRAVQSTEVHEHAHLYWDYLPDNDSTKKKLWAWAQEQWPNLNPKEQEEELVKLIGRAGTALAAKELHGNMMTRFKGLLEVFWKKVKRTLGLMNNNDALDLIVSDLWRTGIARDAMIRQHPQLKNMMSNVGFTLEGRKTGDLEEAKIMLQNMRDLKNEGACRLLDDGEHFKIKFRTQEEREAFELKFRDHVEFLDIDKTGVVTYVTHHLYVNNIGGKLVPGMPAGSVRKKAVPSKYNIPYGVEAVDIRGEVDSETRTLPNDYRTANIGTPVHKFLELTLRGNLTVQEAYDEIINDPTNHILPGTTIEVLQDLYDQMLPIKQAMDARGVNFYEQPVSMQLGNEMVNGSIDWLNVGSDGTAYILDYKTSEAGIHNNKYRASRNGGAYASKELEHVASTGQYAQMMEQPRSVGKKSYNGVMVTKTGIISLKYTLDKKTKTITKITVEKTKDGESVLWMMNDTTMRNVVGEINQGYFEKVSQGIGSAKPMSRTEWSQSAGDNPAFVQDVVANHRKVHNLRNAAVQKYGKFTFANGIEFLGQEGMPETLEDYLQGYLFYSRNSLEEERNGVMAIRDESLAKLQIFKNRLGDDAGEKLYNDIVEQWDRHSKHYNQYIKDIAKADQIATTEHSKNSSLEELMTLYGRLQDIDIVAQNAVMAPIYNHIVKRMAEDQLGKTLTDKEFSELGDIAHEQVLMTAYSDFGKEHPVIQHIAKQYYGEMRKMQSEYKTVMEKGSELAKTVMMEYYKSHPEEGAIYKRVLRFLNPISDDQKYFENYWDKDGNLKDVNDSSLTDAERAHMKFMEDFYNRPDVSKVLGRMAPSFNSNMHIKASTFETYCIGADQGGGAWAALKSFYGSNHYIEQTKIWIKDPMFDPNDPILGPADPAHKDMRLMTLNEYYKRLANAHAQGKINSAVMAVRIAKAARQARDWRTKQHHQAIGGGQGEGIADENMRTTYKMVGGSIKQMAIVDPGQRALDKNLRITSAWHYNSSKNMVYSRNVHKAFNQFVQDMMFEKYMQGVDESGNIDMTKSILQKMLTLEAYSFNKHKNTTEFMDMWINNRLLGERLTGRQGKDFDAVADFFTKWTFLNTMTYNVPMSVMNVIVGTVNNIIFGKTANYKRGVGRYLTNMKDARLGEGKNEAILQHLKILNIEADEAARPYRDAKHFFQKWATGLIEAGEKWIQGTFFLGEMDDKMYDKFEYNADTKELFYDGKKWENLTSDEKQEVDDFVARTGKKISDIQGKYWEYDKRQYGLYATYRAVGQFKTWLPDTYRMWAGKERENMYGETNKGILRTTLQHLNTLWSSIRYLDFTPIREGVKDVRNNWNSDTDPDMINIRREVKASLIVGSLTAAYFIAHGDDDDKKLGNQILSLIKQIAVPFNLRDMTQIMVAAPYQTLEKLKNTLLDTMFLNEYKSSSPWGKTGESKVPDDIMKMMPYNRLWTMSDDYLGTGLFKNSTYGKHHR